MQSHRTLIVFARHVVDWTHFNNAGVVNEDIYPTKPVDDSLNRRPYLIAIEQIAFYGKNFSTQRRELGPGAGEFFWIPRQESNTSAAATDMPSQHQPQSTRSATDHDDFI